MSLSKKRPVMVASHPRSGTHLVMDLLRKQFASLKSWRFPGLPLDHLYLNLERLGSENRQFSDQLARKIFDRPERALMKTHFDANFGSTWLPSESVPPSQYWREKVDAAHIVYVMRHPMDVMVSYKQFLSPVFPEVAEMDLFEFLLSGHPGAECDRLDWWQEHVRSWTAKGDVYVVRFEDIIRQTESILSDLSAKLSEDMAGDKPLLPEKVSSIRKTRLDRFTSFSPESTAIIADLDRWPAVNWRTELSDEHLAQIEDRIGESLASYGYVLSREGAKTVAMHG